MKIELSQREIGLIRVALHMANSWEETVVEAQKHVDWLEKETKRSRQNMRDFKKLYKKLGK